MAANLFFTANCSLAGGARARARAGVDPNANRLVASRHVAAHLPRRAALLPAAEVIVRAHETLHEARRRAAVPVIAVLFVRARMAARAAVLRVVLRVHARGAARGARPRGAALTLATAPRGRGGRASGPRRSAAGRGARR